MQRDKNSAFFRDFVWGNKRNRRLLWAAVGLFLGQFVVFKILYPFANYFIDSYYYLEAAAVNRDVNTWPVAYSKFLRIMSALTHSDTLIVAFQYFWLAAGSVLLYFTVEYFFQPKRIVSVIVFVFLCCNPIDLYIANYVSADALFAGLSLLWFSQLIWILCRPRYWLVFTQAFVLLMIFVLRYNGIYYPLVAVLAWLLSPARVSFKWQGIALGFLLVGWSIFYTTAKMREDTGYAQFSAFGGWQLANNALYAYRHVKPGQAEKLPIRFARLERMVREHMDTLVRIKFDRTDTANTFFYLWSGQGPLVQYMNRTSHKDSTKTPFVKWASVGPLYGAYGMQLLRRYPVAFARYFLWPNTIKYFSPPVEFLAVYNMGKDSVEPLAKVWFEYKSSRIRHFSKNNDVHGLDWYPIMATLSYVLLPLGLLGFLAFKGRQRSSKYLPRALVLATGFYLVNMGLSIFAAPIVLRYQIFPVTLSFVFGLLAIGVIDWEE